MSVSGKEPIVTNQYFNSQTTQNENVRFVENEAQQLINKALSTIQDASPEASDMILRSLIGKLVESHYRQVHIPKQIFIPGKTYIPYAGRVYDHKDMQSLTDATLDFFLTAGRFASQFETQFAKMLGRKHCLLTNSGSSANLLALSALTSRRLGSRRLKPGDEVIGVAAGFPTTVFPVLQNNLRPVFVDVDLGTYNAIPEQIEDAISERTRAIMLAHTLGNPFKISKIMEIASQHELWVIEDNCDSLGSLYDGKLTGTFGHIATSSFYPPHHITMGEGGALATSDNELKRLIESFRDWGRDCWCEPGKDNTCGKRFSQQLGELPYGYDHKYVYSHFGYNLKVTDMQAAVGVAQLAKLPEFVTARKRNFKRLFDGLKPYEDRLILPVATPNSEPAWFAFLITVRDDTGFDKRDLVTFLEERKIGTRMLFAGDITKQPVFADVPYRVVGDLKNTDIIMRQTFCIGVYPGLTDTMLDYVIDMFDMFFKKL